jgi:hypothetical protein
LARASTRELDARSIGTSNTTLAGRTSARKTGTVMKAGVVRSGRNLRNSSSTRRQIARKAKKRKRPEPTGAGAADAIREA